MRQRDEYDDDDSEAERKGVQPFHIPSDPAQTSRLSKKAPPAPQKRPNSLLITPNRFSPMSAPRSVSFPSNIRPIAPAIQDAANTDCNQICRDFEALALGENIAGNRNGRVGRGMASGKDANSFIKAKKSHSHLPQPTPTPVRQFADQPPFRPPSTPRKQAPFLNRFTNDRCPDFYNERMEAMERDFRMFKEQMEGDVRQATDYKDSIQQLQNRGMSERCKLGIKAFSLLCFGVSRTNTATL